MNVKGCAMARNTESAVQRLQVGLIGLLIVLVFVSIANMLIDRSESPSEAVGQGAAPNGGAVAGGKTDTDEPLVEIGVTPVVPEDPDGKAPKSAPAGQN
jgi:hypothetical protein